MDCALNEVPGVTQSEGTAGFTSLLLKTVLSSWMKWGSPPQPLLGEATRPPRAAPGAPGFFRQDLNSCSMSPSPGPRHKLVATPDFISEEAAPPQSQPGALPLASPPPKTPLNATGAGELNLPCPGLFSHITRI